MIRTLALRKEYDKEDVYVIRENLVIKTVKPGEQFTFGNMGTILNTDDDEVISKNMDLLVSGTNIAADPFIIGV